ncbi:hypothetical protein BOX15_Mlig031751g3 [Macrostomum lignano]|uniref:Uncharacterized protein n=2 Tax=Macrostomum lignano TaxID=282301 RepID=A0A267FLR5_9PLAT|nr:hypothetical protein BOX15_Mlig031751g6 [Macrostomum lignano]PAA83218.1 hypothetical protein BOX15_Mlig031751g3 [Macrostomum lignano]
MQFDIRKFDIYRKVPKDLTQPTKAGAVVSIVSVAFILYLFLAEFFTFLSPELVSEVYVDDPVKSYDSIPVYLNISLTKMPCRFVGLDIQDNMGRHEVGFIENSNKRDILDGHGCNFETRFQINKVSGNFHVSTHASEAQPDAPNFEHILHELRFGSKAAPALLQAYGQVTSFAPLNGKNATSTNDFEMHDYYLKIVPSIVEYKGQRSLPFQFTALYRSLPSFHGGGAMPAIWFRYELAPIVVKYKERSVPFYHFLTQICAIVGGTFTVAGIIDSMIFTASEIVKKVELGKLT